MQRRLNNSELAGISHEQKIMEKNQANKGNKNIKKSQVCPKIRCKNSCIYFLLLYIVLKKNF